MVEKVTAYKAMDGQRFEKESEAAGHEVMLLLEGAMRHEAIEGFTVGMWHAILNNSDTLGKALRNFDEAKARELPPVEAPIADPHRDER